MNSSPTQTQNRNWLAAAILALLASLAASPCVAGPIVYSIAGGTQFGVDDLATGAFTPIGIPLSQPVSGIGFGSDGKLYGMGADNVLIRIDPATGNATSIGFSNIALLPFQAFPAVGFATTGSGDLYGLSYDNLLYRFDRSTGAGTEIGPTGVPALDYSALLSGTAGFLKGMAGLENAIYFSQHTFSIGPDGPSGDISPAALYRLDLATGAAMKVGDLDPFTWLLGGIGGALYAQQVQVGPEGPSLALLRIDPNTAAVQTVAAGLAMDRMLDGAAPVPEPAAFALIGAGLFMIAAARRRRC